MIENCWLYQTCNHKDCEADFCLRWYKMNELYNKSLLSLQQRERIPIRTDANGADKEAFTYITKEVEPNIEKFVSSGNNLYIYSHQCGNGKTTSAVRLMQAYFNKIWAKADSSCHGLFVSVPKYLLAVKDRISNANSYADYVKNNIMQADLVIWDDIAAKVGSEFEVNHLLNIIDDRIRARKANIYTSNLNPTEMYEALGERVTSRICNCSVNIQLVGADKRNFSK